MKLILVYLFKYIKFSKLVIFGILGGAILTGLLVYMLPLFIHGNRKDSIWLDIGFVLYFLTLVVFQYAMVLVYMLSSFSGSTNSERLIGIFNSYCGTIFLFATVYFSCCLIGDFNDQVEKEVFYQGEIATKMNIHSEYQFVKYKTTRAFNGTNKLWTGVDNPDNDLLMKISMDGQNRNYYHGYYNNFVNGNIEDVPLDISMRLAALELPTNEMNKLQYQNIKSVFFDCLYFSTLTVTTFGFADVSPLAWYAKLAVIVEILCGLIIFVFRTKHAFY